MFWWIALGVIVVIGLTTYLVRRRGERATPIDQAQVRSARWNNEGKGFGSGGSF